MIAAAKDREHPFDVILVHTMSRFFRNVVDREMHIRRLGKARVAVVVVVVLMTQEFGEGTTADLTRKFVGAVDEHQSAENAKHTPRDAGECATGFRERLVSSPTLLTGVARRATCGSGMTIWTGKSDKYRYYTCAGCAQKGKTVFPGRSIGMAALDGMVIEHLADKLRTPERWARPNVWAAPNPSRSFMPGRRQFSSGEAT